jgi:hypothetical protein
MIARRIRWLCLVSTLVFVGSATAVSAAPLAQLSSSCIRAEDFGAVPNDGKDDRDQLQAAVAAAQAGPGCLELGPGKFHATRRPTLGAASIASVRITGSVSVRGAGEGVTVLAMLGSGTCPGCGGPSNWRLLEITEAANVSVSGLSLDGSERTNTGPQTHLLQVTGPTQHVVIEHVTFTLPNIGLHGGGDCIRLLGEFTQLVRDTTIRDIRGVDCDRSFIVLQRGVDGLVIERSESVRVGVGGQAIDFEPTALTTGDCRTLIRNVFMRDLVLRRAADRALTVAIAGFDCAVTDNVTLTDSVIEDGNVLVINANNVTLSRLTLHGLAADITPTLLARGRIQNLRILDSVIERVAGSGPGNAILITGVSPANPVDALLSGVRVVQATPNPLVQTDNLTRLVIVGSELVYTGAPVGNHAVQVSGSAASPAEAPVLVDTTVRGALAGAITTSGQVNGQPVLVRVTGP